MTDVRAMGNSAIFVDDQRHGLRLSGTFSVISSKGISWNNSTLTVCAV
ncbi:MAG: hypothetical protein OSB13_01580 [Porticoccaceae bacterium]|nr:hypothetical protein [Porticoccaceae bacterium]